MNVHLKNIIYLMLAVSLPLAFYIEARNEHKITCGNGKKISVTDSQVKQTAKACLRAGHPAPKKKFNSANKQLGMQMTQHQGSDDGCEWDPNDARLPDCKKKLKKKDDCQYDPNSAKLPCSNQQASGLLLPAVQSVTFTTSKPRCGSSSSISKALDQCGTKGFKFALCKKNNGTWSCSPSENANHPNVRPTSRMQRK